MRVRWALEELGLAYGERLLSFAELRRPAHLARQPFGQIPTFEEDGLVLFESGAIVLHLAQHHEGLLPPDDHPRARAVAWLFAALNTVEPPIVERSMAMLVEADREWHKPRMALLDERVRKRLGGLSAHLGQDPWLDGAFSAGDLMMVSVLMRLGTSDLLAEQPLLADYVARGQARPAYQQAFAAQLAVFQRAEAAG